MKAKLLLIAAGLAAIAPAARADELPADTMVRPMTIAPTGTPLEDNRIFFTDAVVTLAECQASLQQQLQAMTAADDGIIFACIPVDLSKLPAGQPVIPMVQYSAE